MNASKVQDFCFDLTGSKTKRRKLKVDKLSQTCFSFHFKFHAIL